MRGNEIVKLWTNLKNAYYLDKAHNMNEASQARDTEEKIWPAKYYTSITRSKALVVS